jgi:uncharacterized protein YneF (UPF0154 family)
MARESLARESLARESLARESLARGSLALNYLEKQLESWPRIGTATNGLFATYTSSTDRCDVYDNSLIVNALVMLAPPGEPPEAAIMILNFARGAVEYIREHPEANLKLVAAAYTQRGQQPDLCSDVSCRVQDVGNNAMLCLAIAKFLWRYAEFRDTYLPMLEFLFANIAEMERTCTPDLVGYGGRAETPPDERYISTEHMIDLCGLCHVTQGLFGAELESTRRRMLKHASAFVASMYYEQPNNFAAYRIGTTPSCDLNVGDAQPVDTSTWNVLAKADPDRRSLLNAMETVGREFLVTGDFPGVKFTSRSNCAQYENTGAYLCALTVFNTEATQELQLAVPEAVGSMYDFIRARMEANQPIPGAAPPECPTGLGWSYYPAGHLAATVYCTLASTQNSQMNIYARSAPEPGEPKPEEPEPGEPGVPSRCPPQWPWILAIIVLALLVFVFLGLFVRRVKRVASP